VLSGLLKLFVSGQVGIGTASNDPAALLDLVSTTLGFYPMRMTTTERDAIPSPPIGLQIDNITTNSLERFDGSVWQNMASSGDFFGPGTNTFNALVRFDGTTGKLGKDSNIVVADNGQVTTTTTEENVLRLKQASLIPNYISFEPASARARVGYFGFGALPLTLQEGQVGIMGNGKVILATRGNSNTGGISLLSYDGTTELKEGMLVEDGTDGNPGTTKFRSGIKTHKTNVANTNYTLISSDYRIAITSITAARTITIPTAEIAKGSTTQVREWAFKDQSGSVTGSNTVTIATEGSETIDGAASLVLKTPFFDFKLYADGNNLFVEAA